MYTTYNNSNHKLEISHLNKRFVFFCFVCDSITIIHSCVFVWLYVVIFFLRRWTKGSRFKECRKYEISVAMINFAMDGRSLEGKWAAANDQLVNTFSYHRCDCVNFRWNEFEIESKWRTKTQSNAANMLSI